MIKHEIQTLVSKAPSQSPVPDDYVKICDMAQVSIINNSFKNL